MSTSLNSTPGRLPAPTGRPDTSGGVEGGGAASAAILVVLAIASLLLMQGDANQRILLTLCIGTVLYALLSFAPVAGVTASIIFLALLGGLKRWLIPVLGFQSFDSLMVASPVTIVLLFAPRLLRRDVPRDTLLSRLMLGLLIFMILEIFNPVQGGILVGVAGGMYYIIPVLWYYFGRFQGTPVMLRSLLRTTFVISLFTGLYGQYQQFFGMLESEKLWMHYTNWTLGLGSTLKVFSTFPSTSEYAAFLVMGASLSFVGVLQRKVFSVISLIGFLTMIFFSGNRGPMLLALSTCVVMWSIQKPSVRSWVPRLVVAGICTGIALVVSLASINLGGIKSSTAHDVVQHQISGLSDPVNDGSGASHISLTGSGILYGFTHPLGSGLGSTSLASRLGHNDESDAYSAESDVPNMFISLGAFGGLLYVSIMIVLSRSLLIRWRRDRSPDVLGLIGLLAGQLGFWMMGSHYAETILIWVCIGVIDGLDASDKRRQKAQENEQGSQRSNVSALA